MQNDTPAPPPSQPASAVNEPAGAPGEPTADGYTQNEVSSGLTQFALEVIAVLPSLF